MLLTANTVEAKKIEPEKELPSPQNFIPRASTTYTLYDGGLGGTPDTQSFLYLNLPTGTATQSESGGVTTLDTKVVSMGAYAGYFGDRVTVPQIPVLDRTEGYTLTFTVQVEAEAHGNNNRAGFSVIVLGNDNKGIEMAFWENEIWVQDDDADDPADLFTHAEGVVFSPTVALETYKLIILGDSYSLVVSDTTILSGTLRDYTNFSGPIDPYETPNFIFMGDNTTSAEARIKLSFVSVTTLEKPAPVDYQAYLPFVHHP
jgi:hypothetical protein